MPAGARGIGALLSPAGLRFGAWGGQEIVVAAKIMVAVVSSSDGGSSSCGGGSISYNTNGRRNL